MALGNPFLSRDIDHFPHLAAFAETALDAPGTPAKAGTSFDESGHVDWSIDALATLYPVAIDETGGGFLADEHGSALAVCSMDDAAPSLAQSHLLAASHDKRTGLSSEHGHASTFASTADELLIQQDLERCEAFFRSAKMTTTPDKVVNYASSLGAGNSQQQVTHRGAHACGPDTADETDDETDEDHENRSPGAADSVQLMRQAMRFAEEAERHRQAPFDSPCSPRTPATPCWAAGGSPFLSPIAVLAASPALASPLLATPAASVLSPIRRAAALASPSVLRPCAPVEQPPAARRPVAGANRRSLTPALEASSQVQPPARVPAGTGGVLPALQPRPNPSRSRLLSATVKPRAAAVAATAAATLTAAAAVSQRQRGAVDVVLAGYLYKRIAASPVLGSKPPIPPVAVRRSSLKQSSQLALVPPPPPPITSTGRERGGGGGGQLSRRALLRA